MGAVVGWFSRLALAMRAVEVSKSTCSELSAEPADRDDGTLDELEGGGDDESGGAVDDDKFASSGSVEELS